jgi:hypothetical protein
MSRGSPSVTVIKPYPALLLNHFTHPDVVAETLDAETLDAEAVVEADTLEDIV